MQTNYCIRNVSANESFSLLQVFLVEHGSLHGISLEMLKTVMVIGIGSLSFEVTIICRLQIQS